MNKHLTKKDIGITNQLVKKCSTGNFPGGPVVKTPCFHCRRLGFISGTKIPHAAWHGQKKSAQLILGNT